MASVSSNSNTFLREVHPCRIPKECIEQILLHKVIIQHFPPFNTLKALPCVFIIKSVSPYLQNRSSIIYFFFTFYLPNVPSRIPPAEAPLSNNCCVPPNHPQNHLKSHICAAEAGGKKSREDFCVLCKLGSAML